MTVSQTHYIPECLRWYALDDCKPALTPADVNSSFSRADCPEGGSTERGRNERLWLSRKSGMSKCAYLSRLDRTFWQQGALWKAPGSLIWRFDDMLTGFNFLQHATPTGLVTSMTGCLPLVCIQYPEGRRGDQLELGEATNSSYFEHRGRISGNGSGGARGSLPEVPIGDGCQVRGSHSHSTG